MEKQIPFLLLISAFLLAMVSTATGEIIYVDADAPGANDGTNWADAFNYLQDALADASSNLDVNEICVAQGIYKPDTNSTNPGGSGNREATFQLKNGVAVRGGYAGYGELAPNARDIELYETILSGDLDGNDVQVDDPCDLEDEPTRAENSYHVVTASGTDATAILDGFAITGGNANADYPSLHRRGGGMYGGSAKVTNCTFIGNIGGGIYCSDATISNCTVSGNFGRGIYCYSGTTITNCMFIDNFGGGIFCSGDPTITNCMFVGNEAGSGGGINSGSDSTTTVINCVFSGNTAYSGGGWSSIDNESVLINCTFSANSAERYGHAIGSNSDYSLVITNCIFWGNTGENGSGDQVNGGGTLVNCMLGSDPKFVDADGADDIVGTEDDDLHLLLGSPCINTGTNNTDPPLPLTDLDGNPRIVNGTVDIGAYEFGSSYGVILYVDADAPGANNGSSWANAFNYLQDALAAAENSAGIRVAEGTYKPDQGGGNTPGDREATFQLKNSVAVVRGGYAGYGEANPDARDIELYETILSGDLNGDDVQIWDPCDLLNEPSRAENSYHVVTGSGIYAITVLDGFTITGGNADGDYSSSQRCGGGMYNSDGSPLVFDCTFSGNSADEQGGGIYNGGSSPVLAGCTFIANAAGLWGGGMCDRGRATVTNCAFIGNSAVSYGGGCFGEDSTATFTNCIFSGNTAHSGGGWFSIDNDGTLINCTFSGNSANSGGGIGNSADYSLTLTNCILWGNTPDDINTEPCLLSINHCCIQGWTGDGIGNINVDPLFVDANGPDDIAGTQDDDLRLLPGSPCIDAGTNATHPRLPSADLDDNPRTVNGRVDIGAYESYCHDFLLSSEVVTVPEADTAAFTVALKMDPLGTVEVTVIVESGDSDITIESGAVLTFDPSNYLQPQTVTLAAAEDEDNLNGTAVIRVSSAGFGTVLVEATEADNDPPSVILYVDAGAPGVNNGSSWAEAYTNLQDALGIAAAHPNVEEIRVAQGVYKPDQGGGNTPGDRDAIFSLKNGVAMRGGYAGYGGAKPDARDIKLYETILSGDLNGDDGPDFANNNENSYHVITGSGTDETAVLDGFTTTAGNAYGSTDPETRGGGMCSYFGSPTVTNCTFRNNSAEDYGAGMYNYKGSPMLINCIFTGNWVVLNKGGGMYNKSSNPTLVNCTFIGNSARVGGGISSASVSSPTLTNCAFIDNSAKYNGGGTYQYYGVSTLTNCTFSGNSCGRSGGGMYNNRCSPTLTNCTFSGNSAEDDGGGIYNKPQANVNWRSAPTLTNCILWGNMDSSGSGVSAQIYDGVPVVNYSCVQDWTGSLEGAGNIDTNPCFADPGFWDANGTPGDANDDFWVDGDYHLLPNSPCIDTGDPCYVPGPNETDLGGLPRVFGGRIDMGAYEFSSIEARLWLFPQVINRHNRMKRIMAWVHLPEGVTKDQVDADASVLLYPGAIEPMRQLVFEHGKRGDKGVSIFAFYDKAELITAVPDNGAVDLEVVGILNTGQYFYGSDTVRIIGRRWHRWSRR